MSNNKRIAEVNTELQSFVSLAADPTAMPTLEGLSERKPSVLTTLAVAAAGILAVVTRIGQ